MPRTCPVRGLRRMAIGRSLSLSRVTDPPGPVSVRLARTPSHDASAGRMKAKEELPSPSATFGIAKDREKSSVPDSLRP